jgi:hypothetical protein
MFSSDRSRDPGSTPHPDRIVPIVHKKRIPAADNRLEEKRNTFNQRG